MADEAALPLVLTRLHLLQLETMLARIEQDAALEASQTGAARQLLANHLAEQVFELRTPDYEQALSLATQLVRTHPRPDASPTQVLHPCLALLTDANRFLSFDPNARHFAGMLGLKVFPN